MDLPGPFEANLNDATILRILIDYPNGISKLLRKDDVFILDRRFRDVKEYLEELGYRVLMPALKGKHMKQLTAKAANDSRLVTKVRWPVEVIHGILGQKYNLLHHQMDNKLLPKAGSLCRIACFIQNEFGKRLDSKENMDEIIERI